jgi:hypothetical protein
MLNRRRFLLGSLGSLGFVSQFWTPIVPALAKKVKFLSAPPSGPHILARQSWSPAISADFIGLIDDKHCCLTDDSGRLSVVDLIKEADDSDAPIVLSELNGIGKRIIDFSVAQKRAYALATQLSSDSSESQFVFTIINVGALDAPSVISRTVLGKYLDCTCFTVSQDILCIGGISSSGENLVSIFSIGKGKTVELTALSTLRVEGLVKALDLQDRVLVVLQGQDNSKLDVISLASARSPELKKTLPLDGNFTLLARIKDAVLVGGSSDKVVATQFLNISAKGQKTNAPSKMGSANQLLSIAGQKDTFLVLGETASGNKMIVSYRIDKNQNLNEAAPVLLRKDKDVSATSGRLVIGTKAAFIAAGWSGVQMLSMTGEGWSPTRRYAIPRLPTSGLASWANFVVLAGADLKLYDIAHPEKPSLVSSTLLTTAVRAVTGAGSFILCLSKDTLTLRKIDKLEEIAASLKIVGQQICFDQVQQKAYLLKEEKDKSVATQLKIYSNSIVSKETFDLKAGLSRLFASEGELLAGGLHDLALFTVDEQLQPVGNIHLDNLALRDFVLSKQNIFATAVDEKSQGFLLVFSKDKGQLQALSSTKIPHDGVALSILNQTVATVGRTTDGKNLVSLIDVSSVDNPKLLKSLPAPESASSVTLKDKLAIIAGRGLEIVSLS